LKVVRESPPAVDLDDREPGPIFALERLVAGDIHLAKSEAELLLKGSQPADRLLAEVAAGGVKDDDVGRYG
jgi:hypothetical protein